MDNFLNQQPGKQGKDAKKPVDKKVTRRAVSLNRRIALIFAIIGALFFVLLLTQKTPSTFVLVASKDIQPLTQMDSTSFSIISVDKKSVETGSVSAESKSAIEKYVSDYFEGKNLKSIVRLFPNQQIHPEYFGTSLAEDEQLIAISVKSGDAVIGKINAGDFIDVWAGLQNGAVGLIASNVQVFALGLSQDQLDAVSNQILQQPTSGKSSLIPGNPLPGSYVLKIKTSDVQKFLALSNSTNSGGRIFLTLRSPDAPTTNVNSPIDLFSIICGQRNDQICAKRS